MSDSTQLERRYRRLLALYPQAFRDDHEEEILTVLMAGADEDQTRPRLPESFNLFRHAIFARVRQVKMPSTWERRHARLMFPLRIVIGIWLMIVTAVMYGYGRGGWWGLLLVPSAALHFYLAYRLRHHLQA